MKYWILKLAGHISLIATVVLLGLCVASYFNSYVALYKGAVETSSQLSSSVRMTKARLVLTVWIAHFDANRRDDFILRLNRGASSQEFSVAIEPNDTNNAKAGARWFGWSHHTDPFGELQYKTWALTLPLPLVAFLASLPVAVEFMVDRRRKRRAMKQDIMQV